MQISVIIPTYRPQYYLYQCINSLERQTLSRSEYEVIVVLNGCNEPYRQQIENYLQAHSYGNVVLLQTDEGGVSRARNIGLEEAQGEYVAFVDDDDWVSANYLESLLGCSAPDAIANSNVIQIDEDTQQALPHFLTTAYTICQRLKRLTLFNTRSFLSSVCGKLIPRALIGQSRFETRFALGEDSLFMFEISRGIKRMRLTDAAAVYYVRRRSSSVSHRHYAYGYRVRTALRLTSSYFCLFLRHPFSYSSLLFASRVFATLWKLRKKHYE